MNPPFYGIAAILAEIEFLDAMDRESGGETLAVRPGAGRALQALAGDGM